MKGYKADDLRAFTQALFVGDSFDNFLLQEAEFKTFCLFSIDGATDRNWYTDEELEAEQVEAYVAWKKMKPICLQLIRGKKAPQFFRLTFRLPPGEQELLLRENGSAGCDEGTGAFFLNLRFEKSELHCISLVSFKLFPPNRMAEESWDLWLRNFFEKSGLSVTEL